jgi:protein-disulfide isomerase
MTRILRQAVWIIFILGILGLAAPARAEMAPASNAPVEAPAAFDVGKAAAERVLGNADAPVTIIEYASLTCPHCAQWHAEWLPKIREKLIDKGRARLVFRDYPLDKFALKASLMARCAPAEKYFDLLGLIFAEQSLWVKSDNPLRGLVLLGVKAGLDEAQIKTCMENAELEKALLARMKEAQEKFAIKSTPTFIFLRGEERLEQPPQEFLDVLKQP